MTERRPGSGYWLLGQTQFQQLWAANLVSGLSLVMLQLACGWAMATMTSDALLVASVQMAITVPAFLLGIPFGILADQRGKRALLLIGQVWMLAPECVLALIAWRGQMTPLVLVVGLALIGVGLVMHNAAWKPLLCETFAGDQMIPALSLNSLGSKIGKVAGPAFGGYLTGLAGVAVVLTARILGHLVTVWSVSGRSAGGRSASPSVRDEPSFREGLRFLRTSAAIYGPMLRCGALTAPFAGLLALLPLDAKDNLQTDVLGYGGLLTALGLGTVMSMSLLPWLQRKFRTNPLATTAFAVFSLALVGISRWDSMFLDAFFLWILGFAFGIVTVGHQAAVQAASPDSLRGLMTAFHEVAQQGSMVVGGVVFGLIAQWTEVSASLLIGGLLALGSVVLFWRYPLPDEL